MTLAISIMQAVGAVIPVPPNVKVKGKSYDICPDCKVKPKCITRTNGMRQPYCRECAKRHSRERYLLIGRGK